MIPLQDGMVISFINYEIRVNLEKKDADFLEKERTLNEEKLNELKDSHYDRTVKA